ncbi:CPBP family intramembrane glutamic endopeptidase [Salmonirosea aquatica]|uniref:CPBP family intramembrane metalloprotease n=1 Tax=Salmonirosea aquatica TaxID=2654236 RepID=A0A7C9F8U1_9BACT|nr:CPBP family intramembrane metalloprotease [Cytophagaceae bacterium SJW1-29]
MRQRHLWIILLANGLFALLANLLFFFDIIGPVKSFTNKWPLILLGVMVYSIQIGLIYFLVRKYAPPRWLIQPFRGKEWLLGVTIGLLVWLVANIAQAYRLPDGFSKLGSTRSFARFLPVFLLNSIPGAVIEEYLFRFLPVRFAESQGLSRRRTIVLFLAVLVFFTATHIPAYLWQYHNPLWSLWSPFTMGGAYLFVYYATRNLAFTTLFHAFYNNHWMLYGPSVIKDYSLVIMVSMLWFLWRTNRKNDSSPL